MIKSKQKSKTTATINGQTVTLSKYFRRGEDDRLLHGLKRDYCPYNGEMGRAGWHLGWDCADQLGKPATKGKKITLSKPRNS